MKAAVRHVFGAPEVLEVEDLPKPVPTGDEVLVRVRAASGNPADWHVVRGSPLLMRFMGFGVFRPKSAKLGADIAGEVEAVGERVKRFAVGDAVFGDLSGCGFGGFAEYVCVPESVLAPKPSNLTFEQAAAVPLAALTALHAIRDEAHVQPGHKVLITGASGGVGTFAVQLAKAFGAEVTGVCSTKNVELVRSIGADHVIDYTREDFTAGGPRFDRIVDTAAFRPVWESVRALVPGGTYVAVGGEVWRIFQTMLVGWWVSQLTKRSVRSLSSKPNTEDLGILKNLIEAGKIVPVIDRRYPLREIANAIRYIELGHAHGKVIITV